MAPLEKLVLLDTTEVGRQSLQYGFERDGITVHACTTPSEVMKRCREVEPELCVLALPDSQKAQQEVLAVVDHLRQSEELTGLPVLLVGDRDAREQALKAGADEFVPRPAYLRDILTLARLVVGAHLRGKQEVIGLLEEYGLYFLVRALGLVGRSAVIELERAGRYGELHCVLGDVAAARVGRISGVAAFNHLMLWHDARLRVRLESPKGDRKIFVPASRLLDDGSRFAQKFEQLASKIGGSRAIYQRVLQRAAELRTQVPAEIELFSHLFDGRRALVDVVEEAPFKPLDVIKISHRLLELGAIERVAQPRKARSDEPSVYDWLKGEQAAQVERNTVTEAGRRHAEMLADEQYRRSSQTSPSDDALPQSSLLQRLGEAAQKPTGHGGSERHDDRRGGKKRRHKDRDGRDRRQETGAVPKVNGNGHGAPLSPYAAAKASEAELDEFMTRPFQRVEKLEPEPVTASAEPAPGAKLSKEAAKEAHAKEPHFDAVEDEFFAREADLHRVDPVDNFEDLDAGSDAAAASRWSLKSLFRPVPSTPARPAQKAAPAKHAPHKPHKKR